MKLRHITNIVEKPVKYQTRTEYVSNFYFFSSRLPIVLLEITQDSM